MNTDDESNIRELEKFYIKKYNSIKAGYNSSEETSYAKMSEKTRKAHSIRMKINNPMKNPEAVKRMLKNRIYNTKNILQYSKEGNFIKEWASINKASEDLKIDSSNILRALQGICKSSGNYIWFYKEEFTEELLYNKILRLSTKYIQSEETKRKIGEAATKKISSYLNGEFIKSYNSAKEAARDVKVDPSNISRAARGLAKTCGGYEWKYE